MPPHEMFAVCLVGCRFENPQQVMWTFLQRFVLRCNNRFGKCLLTVRAQFFQQPGEPKLKRKKQIEIAICKILKKQTTLHESTA